MTTLMKQSTFLSPTTLIFLLAIVGLPEIPEPETPKTEIAKTDWWSRFVRDEFYDEAFNAFTTKKVTLAFGVPSHYFEREPYLPTEPALGLFDMIDRGSILGDLTAHYGSLPSDHYGDRARHFAQCTPCRCYLTGE